MRAVGLSARKLGRGAARDKVAAGNVKFAAGKDPLELETMLNRIEPTNKQQLDQMVKLLEASFDKTDATPEQRQALELWKFQMAQGSVSDQIKFQFLRRFYFWLLGRGEQEDTDKTMWGRANVAAHNGEVAAYIDQFLDKRTEYAMKLNLLSMRQPTTLNGYYLYFKYITNGALKRETREDGTSFWDMKNEDYLQDFDLFQQVLDKKSPIGGKQKGDIAYSEIIAPIAERKEHQPAYEDVNPYPITRDNMERKDPEGRHVGALQKQKVEANIAKGLVATLELDSARKHPKAPGKEPEPQRPENEIGEGKVNAPNTAPGSYHGDSVATPSQPNFDSTFIDDADFAPPFTAQKGDRTRRSDSSMDMSAPPPQQSKLDETLARIDQSDEEYEQKRKEIDAEKREQRRRMQAAAEAVRARTLQELDQSKLSSGAKKVAREYRAKFEQDEASSSLSLEHSIDVPAAKEMTRGEREAAQMARVAEAGKERTRHIDRGLELGHVESKRGGAVESEWVDPYKPINDQLAVDDASQAGNEGSTILEQHTPAAAASEASSSVYETPAIALRKRVFDQAVAHRDETVRLQIQHAEAIIAMRDENLKLRGALELLRGDREMLVKQIADHQAGNISLPNLDETSESAMDVIASESHLSKQVRQTDQAIAEMETAKLIATTTRNDIHSAIDVEIEAKVAELGRKLLPEERKGFTARKAAATIAMNKIIQASLTAHGIAPTPSKAAKERDLGDSSEVSKDTDASDLSGFMVDKGKEEADGSSSSFVGDGFSSSASESISAADAAPEKQTTPKQFYTAKAAAPKKAVIDKVAGTYTKVEKTFAGVRNAEDWAVNEQGNDHAVQIIDWGDGVKTKHVTSQLLSDKYKTLEDIRQTLTPENKMPETQRQALYFALFTAAQSLKDEYEDLANAGNIAVKFEADGTRAHVVFIEGGKPRGLEGKDRKQRAQHLLDEFYARPSGAGFKPDEVFVERQRIRQEKAKKRS